MGKHNDGPVFHSRGLLKAQAVQTIPLLFRAIIEVMLIKRNGSRQAKGEKHTCDAMYKGDMEDMY